MKTLLVVALAVSLPSWVRAEEVATSQPTLRFAQGPSRSAVVKAATAVENREPVGEASEFKTGDRIFVWSQVLNADGETVEHVWHRDGKEIFRVHLPIGSAKWRTSSRISKAEAGSYDVEVTAGEEKLGSVHFTVE